MPPRPKPGRKPAGDNASSKRKLQNRIAQRAFRERRAAMVEDLESKLVDIERARDHREMALSENVKELKHENEALRNSLKQVQSNNDQLLAQVHHYQYQLQQLQQQVQILQQSTNHNRQNHGELALLDRALEERLPVPQHHSNHQTQPITDHQYAVASDESCGVCEKDDCLCESIGLKEPKHKPHTAAPQAAVPLKRRPSTTIQKPVEQVELLEIDFTATFARKKRSKKSQQHHPSPKKPTSNEITGDGSNCGFCEDGLPCMCKGNTLPPLVSGEDHSTPKLPTLHPSPPIQEPTVTATSVVNTTNSSSSTSGCTGNPGNCMQCRQDPMSTLFCTTIASRETVSAERSSQQTSSTRSESRTDGGSGVFIPCSDAYRTLSRHNNFKQADFSTIVGKLNTRGMKVEVSSVAKVLRELDKRLYD